MIRSEQARGNPISGLQRMLRYISQVTGDLPPVVPDGIYGTNTRDSVMAFQISYGLPPTGETDGETWERIRAVYHRLQTVHQKPLELAVISDALHIMPGERHAALWVIQGMLKALKQTFGTIPDLVVSGEHAPDSVAAVALVQGVAGLEQTGEIDVRTANAIVGLYSSNL